MELKINLEKRNTSNPGVQTFRFAKVVKLKFYTPFSVT